MTHGSSGISIQEPSYASCGSSSNDEDGMHQLPSSFLIPTQSTLTSEGLLQGEGSNGTSLCMNCSNARSLNNISCNLIN